jgi:WD40 repeat protein
MSRHAVGWPVGCGCLRLAEFLRCGRDVLMFRHGSSTYSNISPHLVEHAPRQAHNMSANASTSISPMRSHWKSTNDRADQFSIPQPPDDAIASIQFSPHPDSLKFVVSSWDKHAYLYELSQGKSCTQIAKFEHRAPVLDACFGSDDNVIYTACLDMTVNR